MIPFADFKKTDGQIDWAALNKARVEAGEQCRTCHDWIFPAKGFRSQCRSCMELATSRNEVTHKDSYRCPRCRKIHKVRGGDNYELYEGGGEHTVTCWQCEHAFTIQTSVTYSFESPALIPEAPDEEEE